eukprot:gene15610-biopygen3706
MTQVIVGNYFRGYSGENTPATSSLLLYPMGGWSDTNGNFYLADQTRIRKIDVFGVMNTVCGNGMTGFTTDGAPATATQVSYVSSLWGDSLGNLFYIDSNYQRLRKIDALSSIVTTMVGGGLYGFNGENVTGTNTTFYGYFLTGDSAGNLYFSDTNNYRIRKFVQSSNKVVTIAGNGYYGYGGELVVATSTSVYDPAGLAVDTSGTVFFIEQSGQRIRGVTKEGILQTIVGTGNQCYNGDGLPGISTDLCNPRSLSIDSLGNLFWVDSSSYRLRKYTLSTGLVSTLIGGNGAGYAGDGLNITSNPSQILIYPQGVWGNSRGDLFIADGSNYRVRSIVNQLINTVAGNGYYSYGGDGGPATSAYINTPASVWSNTLGTVYFADGNNYRIRAISASGIITTLGGTGKNGPFIADGTAFTSMSLSSIQALSGDSNEPNNQRVRLYNKAAGRVWDFAGNSSTTYRGDNVPATWIILRNPYGVWGDTIGNVFFTEYNGYRIRRVLLDGIVTTFAGNGLLGLGIDGRSATSVPIGLPSSVSGDSLAFNASYYPPLGATYLSPNLSALITPHYPTFEATHY